MKLRRILAGAGMIALAAIVAWMPAAYGAASNHQSNADPVVATIGHHQITQKELDQKVAERVLHSISANNLYELRKRELNAMVGDYLVDEAARKAKMTPAQYIAHEAPTSKVTDKEARAFYDKNKARIGRPYDDIKTQLIALLQQRDETENKQALIDKLKSKSPVKILLAPPRFKVTSAGHPWIGGKNAPITIVEFGDFQCPFCRAAETPLTELQKKYGDKIRLVYMDFPLGIHPDAFQAAEAARCASAQDKFWPYHDALFADQSKLDMAGLKATAKRLGLNTKEFDACLASKKYDADIRHDMAEGTSLGVTGTPTFFINGRELEGAQPLQNFERVINEELAEAKGKGNEHRASVN